MMEYRTDPDDPDDTAPRVRPPAGNEWDEELTRSQDAIISAIRAGIKQHIADWYNETGPAWVLDAIADAVRSSPEIRKIAMLAIGEDDAT